MNFYSSKQQSIVQPLLNYQTVAKDFCDLYYHTISTKGMSGVAYLFDQNIHCIYSGREYIGFQNIPNLLLADGIIKVTYENLTYVASPLDSDLMMIQVSGLCQGHKLMMSCPVYSFVETFVLKYANSKIYVSTYIFHV